MEQELEEEADEHEQVAHAVVQEEEHAVVEEDWSSKAVKNNMGDASTPDKPGLHRAFQTLRSKVKESDSTFDMIAMGGILFVILVAVFIKLTLLKPKKGSKSS
mmetsp:Transcript_26085/g.43512  ORF Transcript_26085/g.43512 Transcript_26085/m.43512 type:complete len:103 (-) Transcript_26085:9-317(-)